MSSGTPASAQIPSQSQASQQERGRSYGGGGAGTPAGVPAGIASASSSSSASGKSSSASASNDPGRHGFGERRPVVQAEKGAEDLLHQAKEATVKTADKAQDTMHRLVPSDERRRWLGYMAYDLFIFFPLAWLAAAWVYFSSAVLFLTPFWPLGNRGASIQKWIGLTWKNLAYLHLDIWQFVEADPNRKISSGFEHLKGSEEKEVQEGGGVVRLIESPMAFIFYFGAVNPIVATIAFWTVLPLSFLMLSSLLALLPFCGSIAKYFFFTQKKLADDLLLHHEQESQAGHGVAK